MNDNIFKLIFQASANGFGQVINQTQTLQQKVSKLAQGASILGSAFGHVGGAIGRAFGMFLQGGVWGAAAEGIKLVIEKTGILKKRTDELNGALEATRRHFDEIKAKYSEAASLIDKETESKKRQIEITKNQAKAELQLAAAKAKANGDDAKAVKLAGEIAKVEGEAAKKAEKLTVEQADKKLAAARKAASTSRFIVKDGDNKPGMEEGDFDKKAWSKELRRLTGEKLRVEKTLENEKKSRLLEGGSETIKDPDRDERIATLEQELEATKEARKKLVESAKHEREIAANLKQAVQDRKDALAIEKTAETTAKTDVVTSKTAARDEAVKKEQSKLTANAGQLASAAKPESYRSRFESAFELWRDPAAAQEAQDAAKAKTADMTRFGKTVGRYGGKWRIDEAARLMREGDEEGLQARLAEWRKSSKFNGQTEQMVLAAAAKQNENAAQKSLDEIKKTSAEINQNLAAIKQAFEGGE